MRNILFACAEFTDAIVQVPLRMLTPNLHILVCRFPVQEALRGLVSLELEYFMERYMSNPQRGMRALHAEKNYLNSTEMPRRALLPAAVYHGFRTPDQLQQSCVQQQPRVVDRDPDAAAGSAPFFEMEGTRIRVTSPLARLGVDPEFLVLRLAYIVAQESASGAKRQAQHATKLAALYSVQSAAIAQLQVAACTAGAAALSSIAEALCADIRIVQGSAVALRIDAKRTSADAAAAIVAVRDIGNASLQAVAPQLRASGGVLTAKSGAAVQSACELRERAQNFGAAVAALQASSFVAADAEAFRTLSASDAQHAVLLQCLVSDGCGWWIVPITLDRAELLSHFELTSFAQCSLDGFTACSQLNAVGEGSKAACAVWTESVNVLQDGNVKSLVHVVGYLLLVHTGAGVADGLCKPAPLRLALVEKSAGWEADTMLGMRFYRVPVRAFLASCIVLAAHESVERTGNTFYVPVLPQTM